ncbi:N-acetyl-gamma-glutamyl-phosphate reductase [Candidatus Gottesmanbacteria bacterium]|nr:N-acetyl-gamma-glutamyl-phosphate reductase [Candidatus Gottesmanbacteria bacterium]
MKIKAEIIGGSGYIGGELLRHLLFHPNVEIIGVTSIKHIGQKISTIHPNLFGVTDMVFESDDVKKIKNCDIVFFALPHGLAMEKVKQIDLSRIKVIDMSADFRLRDVSIFESTYKIKNTAGSLLNQFVYGLPEINRDQVVNARLVASPGCFPTGAVLALYPLIQSGLSTGSVIIDSKTGSSGSGNTPSETTHHSERDHDFKAYNIFNHRHQPEIVQTLSEYGKLDIEVIFTPHSAPMVRGIFTTAYAFLEKESTTGALEALYKKFYKESLFIRFVEQSRSSVVMGTNYCDIAIHVQGKKVIVTTAIDNLVKGGAGQAVQSMNLMFGLKETKGLEFPGLHP